MSWLSDETIGHLREVAGWPDLSGTRYEVTERVARGGMGEIYRAHDRELDRDVALKVLSVPRLDDDARSRMRREARILARLEHPGIVPVHDVGLLPDGRVYYAMKLVQGSRLDEYARANPDLGGLLRVFERACEAVAFAHSHGVIHRDLKPENVMVGAFGEVLVMDWGVAKILGQGAPADESAVGEPPTAASTAVSTTAPPGGPTNPGTVLGTPGYMAPEQAAGRVDHVGRPADVFALGVILRGLVNAAGGAVPKPLAAMIDRATAPKAADRYESVERLAAEVPRFLSERTVSAYREAPWERIARNVRKYRVPILMVLFYVAARLLILLFAGT